VISIPENGRPDAVTPSLPEQRKDPVGSSAVSILREEPSKVNEESPHFSAGNLKAHLFDLADQDRAALALIRERLDLNSNALAVRLSIRALARRLAQPSILADVKKGKP